MPNFNCSICSKNITTLQSKIVCSTCNKPFHGSCCKLTANDLNYITESGDNWSCASCNANVRVLRSNSCSSSPVDKKSAQKNVSNKQLEIDQFSCIMEKLSAIATEIDAIKTTQLDLKADVASIKSTQDLLTSEITKCSTAIELHNEIITQQGVSIENCVSSVRDLASNHFDLVADVDTLKNKIISVETDLINLNNSQPSSSIAEIAASESLDRLKRASNIIIRGIPESKNVLEDQDRAVEVIRTIDNASPPHILSIVRLGNVNAASNSRLLKVCFSSPTVAFNILRNKKSLIGTQFKRITIHDDKTPQQLNNLNELRNEFKIRQERGESDITIKYVKGVPNIVTTKPKN